MNEVFVIEDEAHAESQGEFATLKEAISELQRLAQIPWDQEPNQAPCTNWKNCGRRYEVIEYDCTSEPWEEMRRTSMLNISANAIRWTPLARDFAVTTNSDPKELKNQFTKSFKAVRKILMDGWDPIGVSGAIVANDEYDTYVNKILSIPKDELSNETLANYLITVRQELMGLTANDEKDKKIATQLAAFLNLRIEL